MHLLCIQSGEHVIDDSLRILEAGIVAGDNHFVALLDGFLGHERALAVITVTACSTYGDDVSLAVEHFMDGTQHVLQSVGSVGIVDNGREAFGRLDGFQTSADAVECAQDHEDLLRLLAQHTCGSIYSQQVADVEFTDELHADLMSVNVEIHSSEVHLDDAGAEVSHLANGVGLHGSLCVLHHDHAVLVIGIGDGESRLGQSVEESLLGIAIVLKGLVIIEVITSEVGEDSTCEFQSADTLLSDGVA